MGLWSFGRSTRLEIAVGYGAETLVRSLKILIENRVRIVDLNLLEKDYSSAVPVKIELIIDHPGRRRLAMIIKAIDLRELWLSRAFMRPVRSRVKSLKRTSGFQVRKRSDSQIQWTTALPESTLYIGS